MNDFKHYTVMLNEAVDALECQDGKIYVDCTLGGGGHSELILQRISPNGRLIAFDIDDEAILHAKERLKHYKNLTIVKTSYINIKSELMNSIVIDKFNSIKKKIEVCQEIENSIKENESDSFVEDDLKMELSVSTNNDKIKHDILGDMPSFSSYYNEKVRMTYHEKFIRETAMDFEQT